MIHLWARFSPSHPRSGLILDSYREFIIRKGKLPVGINPAQLPPRPATLLTLHGRGHIAQGIFPCLANSSLACGIIHWGKLPWSNSQSVLASWAGRTEQHKSNAESSSSCLGTTMHRSKEDWTPTPASVMKLPIYPALQVPRGLATRARQLIPGSSLVPTLALTSLWLLELGR